MSDLLNIDAEPAIAPKTETVSIVEPKGSFLDSIPEDIRNEPSLGSIKDVAALAKSYVSAQRMLGGSIRIPGADASAEAKEEFFKRLESVPNVVRLPDSEDAEATKQFLTKLGRPETAEAYDIKLPDGAAVDAEVQTNFKKLAFDLGLNKKQAQALSEFNIGLKSAEHESLIKTHAENEATIKQQWGQAFEERLTAAKLVIRSYSDKMPNEIKELVTGPLGNNPALLQILADYGKTLHENQSLQGSSKLTFGRVTPDEAREKRAEILSNRAHAYHNAKDPAHNDAVEKMSNLYQAIHGQQDQ